MVAGILRAVRDEAARHGVGRITLVRLRIGVFTAVEPETLKACFALAAEGGVAGGAELVVETVPAEGRCLTCGADFVVTRTRVACPVCAGADVTWQGGRECVISGLVADEPGSAGQPATSPEDARPEGALEDEAPDEDA